MQLKSRFLLLFVGIALFGLILIGIVSYNSAHEYGANLKKNALDDLSVTIASTLKDNNNLESVLDTVRNIKIDHFGIYIVDAENNIHILDNGFRFLKSSHIPDIVQDILLNKITSGNQHSLSEVDFSWQKTPIPETPFSLILINEFSKSDKSAFFTIFGIPLFVVGLVVLWLSIWGALILASLFKKLDHQNAILQAAKERALQASNVKSEFLANMSHEIRTPLTAILGFSESLLQRDQSKEESYNAIITIIRSGKHLIGLVNDILDISKIEADRLEIENIEFSPVKLMIDLESMVKMQAQNKKLNIDVKYIFPMPEKIKSDPSRLRQILYNLCSNAIKFTEQGYIVITVSYKQEQQKVYFEVADTGIGIKNDEASKIFNRFSQADSSISREYGGTGLGLSLSRELAEKLGGSLTVESEYGVGSRFTVSINCGQPENTRLLENISQLPRQSISAVMPPPSLSGKVLLVEDNPDNQRLFSLLMRKTGIELYIAPNGKQAVDMALEKEFDVIFMDMQMPVMDGTEAVKRLRGQNYKNPIIALTANAMSESREKCISIGCNDFISKPVDRNRLYLMMSEYLRINEDAAVRENTLEPIQSPLFDDPHFGEIVTLFISGLGKRCDNIRSAVEKQDWETLLDILHQLKGSGGGVGFPMITEIAEKISNEIKAQEYHKTKQSINEFYQICERIFAGEEKSAMVDTG